MKSMNNRFSSLVSVGVILTAVSVELKAEISPFEYQDYKTVNFQIADLYEEGCGGEMTEYRRTPKEEEVEKSSEDSEQKTEDNAEPKKGQDDEKEKSFWSWLFG